MAHRARWILTPVIINHLDRSSVSGQRLTTATTTDGYNRYPQAEVQISGTLFTSGYNPPNSALIPYSSVLLQQEHYMIIKSLLLCLSAVFAKDIISGESHLQF